MIQYVCMMTIGRLSRETQFGNIVKKCLSFGASVTGRILHDIHLLTFSYFN